MMQLVSTNPCLKINTSTNNQKECSMDDRRQLTVVSLKPETEKAFFDILEEQSRQLAKLEQLCEGFSKAIPGDDPIGHRKYHELVIAREEKRAAFMQAIIEKSVLALLWSGIVAIGTACIFYVQHMLGLKIN